MGVRKSDYEDENGNVDWDAYGDAQDDYGDMKYQEWKDDRMEKEDEIEKIKKPELKLLGTDGNVFSIIGKAQKSIALWNRKYPSRLIDVDEFNKEAMSGDYDHVIQTCMKYFEVS